MTGIPQFLLILRAPLAPELNVTLCGLKIPSLRSDVQLRPYESNRNCSVCLSPMKLSKDNGYPGEIIGQIDKSGVMDKLMGEEDD